MGWRSVLFGVWLAAAPVGAARADAVRATDYDAFWLWAAVTPQPVLNRARSLYLIQGQVDPGPDGAPARLIAQGGAPTALRGKRVWLAYRVRALNWPAPVYSEIAARIGRWRAAGADVAGVQIDFDAATRHLDDYAAFLKDLKARLPAGCGLSVTGLLDWSAAGDPAALAALGGTVDEVVVQTYRGRRSVADYGDYLSALQRLRFPFRIGLVQGGDWTAPAWLAGDPWFRGYVVFLVNPRRLAAGAQVRP